MCMCERYATRGSEQPAVGGSIKRFFTGDKICVRRNLEKLPMVIWGGIWLWLKKAVPCGSKDQNLRNVSCLILSHTPFDVRTEASNSDAVQHGLPQSRGGAWTLALAVGGWGGVGVWGCGGEGGGEGVGVGVGVVGVGVVWGWGWCGGGGGVGVGVGVVWGGGGGGVGVGVGVGVWGGGGGWGGVGVGVRVGVWGWGCGGVWSCLVCLVG